MAQIELFRDDFQRPDESPLDPNKWNPTTDFVIFGIGQLAIISHLCVEDSDSFVSQGGGSEFINLVFPSNQYIEATISSFVDSDGFDEIQLFLRQQSPTSVVTDGYTVTISGPSLLPLGAIHLSISKTVGGVNTALGITTLSAVNPGDILHFEIVGNSLLVEYNDVPMLQATDNSFSSGSVAAYILGSATQTSASFSLVTAGSIIEPASGGANGAKLRAGTVGPKFSRQTKAWATTVFGASLGY